MDLSRKKPDLHKDKINGPIKKTMNSHLVSAVNPREIPNIIEYFLFLKYSVFNNKRAVKATRHIRTNSTYAVLEKAITPGKEEKIKAAKKPAFPFNIFFPIPYIDSKAILK